MSVDLLFNIGTLQPLKRWSTQRKLVSVTVVATRLFCEICILNELFCSVENEVAEVEDQGPKFALEPKLFGKWSYQGCQIDDISLANYLQVKTTKQQVYIPYTAGRYQQRRFKKVQCPVIERLTVMLMTSGGRNNGKKQMAIRTVKQTMELIYLLTGKNPV